MPVIAGGQEVDRILLSRVDPAHFQIVVRNAPAGNRELGDWMRNLDAALVINGSYFSRHGVPTTPFLSDRTELGPTSYVSQHGALVASAASTKIIDLAHEDWKTAFVGADDALVSYPMLIGTDGQSRAGSDSRWLANRSFVGQDSAGMIIFGTTAEAFFSISRLAGFLRSSTLGLTLALNLDGGPGACQGIKLGNYTRKFCGKWEFAFHDGKPELLEAAVGKRRWGLPVVVAVLPR